MKKPLIPFRCALFCACILFLSGFHLLAAASDNVGDDRFVQISEVVSPYVAYAFQDGVCHIKVEEANGTKAKARLGVYNDTPAILDEKSCREKSLPNNFRIFSFALPEALKRESGLRLGLEVSWMNPDGKIRQRETFFRANGQASGQPLTKDSKDWGVLDLKAYESLLQDRSRKMAFYAEQPFPGKMSVVIDDSDGKRIRNLFGGKDMQKGSCRIEWDGLDEFGRLVKHGTYKWRAVSHIGITPHYLFQFDNGNEKFMFPFGSNHGHFTVLAANGRYVFAGATITEGGWSLIAMSPDGTWRRGYRAIHGTGIRGIAIAADEKTLFVLHDGDDMSQKIDRTLPGWKGDYRITLTRFDIETSAIVEFEKRKQFVEIENYVSGPGGDSKLCKDRVSVSGAAFLDNKLYVSSFNSQALLVVNPETGKVEDRISLKEPGALSAFSGKLYALSGRDVVEVDLKGGQHRAVIGVREIEPAAIAVRDGSIYVSDKASNTVKVFSAAGALQKTIGTPGGKYQGAFIPERMVNPCGLAVSPNNWLWVAEDNKNPKRLLAWDLAGSKVAYQKFGCPPYGSPGSGFDPLNKRIWLGQQLVWDLDFEKREASVKSIMYKEGGHLGGLVPWCRSYKFVHREGRTYLLGAGKSTIISELMPDGSVKDMVLFSTVAQFLYSMNWKCPAEFAEALSKKFSDAGKLGKGAIKPELNSLGVLWTDMNGDGLLQADEFQLGTLNTSFGNFAWGPALNEFNLLIPFRKSDGSAGIVKLAPREWRSGVPQYDLQGACDAAVTPRQSIPEVRSLNADFGIDSGDNLIMNTDPYMTSYAADGRLLWFYPNKWSGVHGSHNAPLPSVGEMQGVLFFLGFAPLSDGNDVFMVNGNHGRFFALTSDGIYLDEMFNDCRVAEQKGKNLVGGEPFGGFFGYSAKDSNYYLQTGNPYRIYKINGLNTITRSSGEINVTSETLMAAERSLAEKAKQQAAQMKTAEIAKLAGAIRINGDAADWKDIPVTAGWEPRLKQKVTVKAAYDDKNLYIIYSVPDSSPWVNRGEDWTALFKTGDSVDLQLATDPKNRAKRNEAAVGDIRLLFAPFHEGNLAVLYSPRLGRDLQAKGNPVVFTSPWRSEKVDDVRQLKGVEVKVSKQQSGYVLEALIPLKELGVDSLEGKILRGDFGVIFGDEEGTVNLSRSYWSNKATGLVNDVPGEIMLQPDFWGELNFSGRGK